MIDLKVILHPTDFSEMSLYALPYAIEFARRYSARLDLVHVLELPYSAISMAEEACAEARDKLEGLVPGEQREGLEITTNVVRGKPFVEIVRLARDGKLRQKLGLKARELAVRSFTWEKNAERALGAPPRD